MVEMLEIFEVVVKVILMAVWTVEWLEISSVESKDFGSVV